MTKDEVFFLFLFCFSFLEINLICVHWGYTNTQACLAICCTLQNYTLLCQLCFFSGSFHWICGTTLRILVENSSKRKKKSQLTVDPVTKSTTLKSWRVFQYKFQKQMGLGVSRDLSYSNFSLPIDIICRYGKLEQVYQISIKV